MRAALVWLRRLAQAWWPTSRRAPALRAVHPLAPAAAADFAETQPSCHFG